MKKFLPLLAVLLIIFWIVARVALAITGFFLHLLWILAVLIFVVWLVFLIRGKLK